MKRLLLLLPMLVLLAPAPIQSQASNRAGVVIRFGDGSVHTSCVEFSDESISGFELLQRSGVELIAQTSGSSAAVCKIGPDGCDYPAESCLKCKFGPGGQGEYWAYWQLVDSKWRYSQLGAAARRVRNGDVDGWAYGPGNVQTGAEPPVLGFEQICPALPPTVVPATATPKPQPTAAQATATPKPQPTAAQATATPKPQPTVAPTPQPALEPTMEATAVPTARPTLRPEPTAAIVASAPTPTPERPTATPIAETPTAQPTNTLHPTNTAAPTATIVATTLPSATPSPPSPTVMIAGAEPARQQPNPINYIVFGLMVVGLLGAIGIALRRRTA